MLECPSLGASIYLRHHLHKTQQVNFVVLLGSADSTKAPPDMKTPLACVVVLVSLKVAFSLDCASSESKRVRYRRSSTPQTCGDALSRPSLCNRIDKLSRKRMWKVCPQQCPSKSGCQPPTSAPSPSTDGIVFEPSESPTSTPTGSPTVSPSLRPTPVPSALETGPP